MPIIKMLSLVLPVLLAALAGGCSVSETNKKSTTTDITIFSINDFHGNLQADKPVPYMSPSSPSSPRAASSALDAHGHSDHTGVANTVLTPSGGYAYLAAVLRQRRQAVSASILVGAGDLIGASPIGAAILRDEPVIEALNQLDLSVTAVGNHEFDHGAAALLGKIKGECPAIGCAFPGFSGARYEYIAANVLTRSDASSWLKPYVIRQVGEVKVAFIGAVTMDTPNLVAGDGVKQLSFEDEASAVNRYVPELLQQGVAAIVLLIHEGGSYQGAANDPSYRCEGLQGPIIAIAKKLDKAISLVVSGHSHQAYTCKIDGRMVVQGRSYGAYLTETTLTIDRSSNQVIKTAASNHLIDQTQYSPDPKAQQLVDQVAAMTMAMRNRPVATLVAPLLRSSSGRRFDSSLGNVIADSQLVFAQKLGAADVSFMNAGGIRNDLPSGAQTSPIAVNYGDIYAVQPFGNNLISMQLSGAQLLELLQQQWQGRAADDPKKLFVSEGFSYRWNLTAAAGQRLQELRLHGQAVSPQRQYTVVVNSFLADGGDGFTVFKQGTERKLIGRDLDAFEAHVHQQGPALSRVATDRVQRID